MTELNTTVFNLIGKKVSFSISNSYQVFHEQGTVTEVVLSFDCPPQISLDKGDFFSFDLLIEFQVLD